ncbi:hypothetical protein [Acidovorax sp. LjRoot194]|uniref:hypothetical protein n=1 Tax=Acidovorax sp. LjRoot194 TaxID=3342280 RepID=UPI003ECC2614
MNLHEQRVNYSTIKQWAMDAYFYFSRDRGVILGRPHAEIIGGVFMNMNFHLIEKLND